jgi:lipopolysaccharide export system protein LptA
MKLIYTLLFFFTFCWWTAPTSAATLPFSDDNIHINADRMSQNQADNAYTADGNVVVHRSGASALCHRFGRFVKRCHDP